ncbi:MAG: GtrA family protein [Clostridia bacterium]|nr:GtrA family protein [Clostridia bacterium]
MNKIKAFFVAHREPILYVLFGGATTVVNFVSFKLFNVLLGDEWYLISNVFAWLIAVLFAYLVNKRWVFESHTRAPKAILRELLSFLSARLVSLAAEQLGLFLLVDIAGLGGELFTLLGITLSGTMIAKMLLAVIVVILNYFFSKFVVFKTKE